MGKLAGWVLVLLIAGGGVAQAKRPVMADRWETVESLTPGTEINVASGNAAGPDLCLVSVVDADSLTCLAERMGGDTRLVFPRSAVRDVWVFEPAPDRRIGLWIAAALSVGLEIAACVGGGVGGGVLAATVIGAVWAAATTPPPWAVWMPPPPPKPTRWRRRLVYRAAAPIAP